MDAHGSAALPGSGAFLLLALTSSYLLFIVSCLLTGVAMTLTFYVILKSCKAA